MRKKIYLHLGYPKTGTTLLQKKIFPFLRDIKYLGKSYKSNNLLDRYNEVFALDINVVNYLRGSLNKVIEIDDLDLQDKNLLSEETILFSMLRPQLSKNNDGAYFVESIENVINRIKNIFNASIFDIHILITLRNHKEMLQSAYAESYYHCYRKCENTNTFNKFLDEILDPQTSIHKSLDYFYTIKELQSSFGKNNVHILLYEDMKKDHRNYIKKLQSILELDEIRFSDDIFEKKIHTRKTSNNDIRISNYVTVYDFIVKFRLNHLLTKNVLDKLKTMKFHGSVEVKVHTSLEYKERILKSFEESNRNLEKEYNIELTKEYYV